MEDKQHQQERVTHTTVNDKEDDDDADIFLLDSKRQERLAEERRIQRRKRLREIANAVTTEENDMSTTDSLSNKVIPQQESYDPERRTKIPTTTTSIPTEQEQFPGVVDHRPTQLDAEEQNLDPANYDDNDEFDMFSSSVSPPNPQNTLAVANHLHQEPNHHHRHQLEPHHKNQQDWDDSEGYYKAAIGETIDLLIHPSTNITTTATETSAVSSLSASSLIRIRVAGLIGKGVFSTVLKCTVISNNTALVLPNTIAVKCIRHNDSMTKTAITTELCILQKLRHSPGIVSLLLPTSSHSTSSSSNNNTNGSNNITPLEYRGHILFVFPCMEYNLRDVLQKFGKGIGISLPAVRSYFGQLLAALSHLHKFRIIHADIKPDNVLVSADFTEIQIADFGSAMDLDSPDHALTTMTTHPTPYLVSRFYRAPEIILGLVPITHMIDLWSVAVTVAELYIGEVLFRGTSNNDMLYVFQQHLGPFTNRMIRQHLIQCQKFGTGTSSTQQLSPHFQLLPGTGNSYHFTQRTTDTVTGTPVLKVLSLLVSDATTANDKSGIKFPLGTPLATKLLRAKSAKDTRKMVHQFIDLLTKCLILDPSRRIGLKDALRHEFFIVNTTNANQAAGSVTK